MLTCGGRHSRDRETLDRFSTNPDGHFRIPEETGSEPRLSETGERNADAAKKGGNEESRERRGTRRVEDAARRKGELPNWGKRKQAE